MTLRDGFIVVTVFWSVLGMFSAVPFLFSPHPGFTGPGLGIVATSFGDAGKWLAVFAMLLGRLEVFTLVVLLTPAFWRQ